jgi:hypothetical protein
MGVQRCADFDQFAPCPLRPRALAGRGWGGQCGF